MRSRVSVRVEVRFLKLMSRRQKDTRSCLDDVSTIINNSADAHIIYFEEKRYVKSTA